MDYSDRIRDPNDALNPQPEKSGWPWWFWLLLLGGAAFILTAIFRPAWLARVGVHVNLADAAKAVGGAVSNPMGWVG